MKLQNILQFKDKKKVKQDSSALNHSTVLLSFCFYFVATDFTAIINSFAGLNFGI